jgi:hypothetical protein
MHFLSVFLLKVTKLSPKTEGELKCIKANTAQILLRISCMCSSEQMSVFGGRPVLGSCQHAFHSDRLARPLLVFLSTFTSTDHL